MVKKTKKCINIFDTNSPNLETDFVYYVINISQRLIEKKKTMIVVSKIIFFFPLMNSVKILLNFINMLNLFDR